MRQDIDRDDWQDWQRPQSDQLKEVVVRFTGQASAALVLDGINRPKIRGKIAGRQVCLRHEKIAVFPLARPPRVPDLE